MCHSRNACQRFPGRGEGFIRAKISRPQMGGYTFGRGVVFLGGSILFSILSFAFEICNNAKGNRTVKIEKKSAAGSLALARAARAGHTLCGRCAPSGCGVGAPPLPGNRGNRAPLPHCHGCFRWFTYVCSDLSASGSL